MMTSLIKDKRHKEKILQTCDSIAFVLMFWRLWWSDPKQNVSVWFFKCFETINQNPALRSPPPYPESLEPAGTRGFPRIKSGVWSMRPPPRTLRVPWCIRVPKSLTNLQRFGARGTLGVSALGLRLISFHAVLYIIKSMCQRSRTSCCVASFHHQLLSELSLVHALNWLKALSSVPWKFLEMTSSVVEDHGNLDFFGIGERTSIGHVSTRWIVWWAYRSLGHTISTPLTLVWDIGQLSHKL